VRIDGERILSKFDAKAEIKLIFRNVWILEQSGMSGWRSKSGVVCVWHRRLMKKKLGLLVSHYNVSALPYSATDWFLQLLIWLTANCSTDCLLTNVLTVHCSNAIRWDAEGNWQELTADILTDWSCESARGPGGLEDGRWRRGWTERRRISNSGNGDWLPLTLEAKEVRPITSTWTELVNVS